jgi:hypothetical protein
MDTVSRLIAFYYNIGKINDSSNKIYDQVLLKATYY